MESRRFFFFVAHVYFVYVLIRWGRNRSFLSVLFSLLLRKRPTVVRQSLPSSSLFLVTLQRLQSWDMDIDIAKLGMKRPWYDHLKTQTTIYKWMFGETTIFLIKIWNHPTETTIKKWMFRVLGSKELLTVSVSFFSVVVVLLILFVR